MADVIAGIRQRLALTAEKVHALKRLHDTGILEFNGVTLETARNAAVYGPQATMVIQGGRKYPSLPAIVDERGTLTYKQVDDQSTALGRGLGQMGSAKGRSWVCCAAITAASSSRWRPAASWAPGWC